MVKGLMHLVLHYCWKWELFTSLLCFCLFQSHPLSKGSHIVEHWGAHWEPSAFSIRIMRKGLWRWILGISICCIWPTSWRGRRTLVLRQRSMRSSCRSLKRWSGRTNPPYCRIPRLRRRVRLRQSGWKQERIWHDDEGYQLDTVQRALQCSTMCDWNKQKHSSDVNKSHFQQ